MSKSYLNQYSQKNHISGPTYNTETTGDGFTSTVTIEDTQYSSLSTHSTKKDAEKDVANVAAHAIIQNHPTAKTFEDVLKSLDDLSLVTLSKQQAKQSQISNNVGPRFVPDTSSSAASTQSHPSNSGHAYQMVPPHVQQRLPVGSPTGGAAFSPQLMMGGPFTNSYYGPPPGFAPVSPHSHYEIPHNVMPRMPNVYPRRGVPIHPSNVSGQMSTRQPVYRPFPIVAHLPQPRPQRPNIPLSVEGPSIDSPSPSQAALDKPLNAIPVKQVALESSISEPPPLTRVQPVEPSPVKESGSPSFQNTEKDVQDLELYCKVSRLPAPIYSIYELKGKHFGRVKIGMMEFEREWGYDTFNDAKDSAAIVAIAGLAMIKMRMSKQQGTGNQERNFPPSSSPLQPITSQSQVSLNPGQVRIIQRPPPISTSLTSPPITTQVSLTGPLTTVTTSALQTPSYFQQPVSRGGRPISNIAQQDSQQTISVDTPQQVQISSTSLNMSNYKSLLNIYCQKNHFPMPIYECSSPEDSVGYVSVVTVNGRTYKSVLHGTKRAAEADAACVAVTALGLSVGSQESGLNGAVSASTVSSAPSSVTVPTKTFVSYKNLLQEKAQKEKQPIPRYSTERSETAEGSGFISTVTVFQNTGPIHCTSSVQPVKKGAEQEAARQACIELNLIKE